MCDKRIRVLLVDDSQDLAEMFELMVGRVAGEEMESVGALQDTEGLVGVVGERRADVVVMDLSIPGFDSFGAIRELAAAAPACKVVAYSGYDDSATRGEARAAGACELVSKHDEPMAIVEAIRRAGGADQDERRAAAGEGSAR